MMSDSSLSNGDSYRNHGTCQRSTLIVYHMRAIGLLCKMCPIFLRNAVERIPRIMSAVRLFEPKSGFGDIRLRNPHFSLSIKWFVDKSHLYLDLVHHAPLMMVLSAARTPLSKVPTATPLVTRRSYVATTSIVDAKARVQERARRSISGSASKNATPAPAQCVHFLF